MYFFHLSTTVRRSRCSWRRSRLTPISTSSSPSARICTRLLPPVLRNRFADPRAHHKTLRWWKTSFQPCRQRTNHLQQTQTNWNQSPAVSATSPGCSTRWPAAWVWSLRRGATQSVWMMRAAMDRSRSSWFRKARGTATMRRERQNLNPISRSWKIHISQKRKPEVASPSNLPGTITWLTWNEQTFKLMVSCSLRLPAPNLSFAQFCQLFCWDCLLIMNSYVEMIWETFNIPPTMPKVPYSISHLSRP